MKSLNKNQLAHILQAQKHQVKQAQIKAAEINVEVDQMLSKQEAENELLDALILQAQSALDVSQDGRVGKEVKALTEAQQTLLHTDPKEVKLLDGLDVLNFDENCSSADYYDAIKKYAEKNKLKLEKNPFLELMPISERIKLEKRIKEDLTYKNAQCDRYDYAIAGMCGILGGLIDVLFVGMPGSGQLGAMTDDWADLTVQKFASLSGWKGARGSGDPTKSAIGHLERTFKVNYDHRHGGDVEQRFKMSSKNHHIKSLGHSPDLVGLVFSIINQFSNTASFVNEGKLITLDTETFELKGENFIAKIFSGFVNWLGHLFSDVAGSSGAGGRGSGLPIPFFSLLQFANVGEFGQHKQSFAKIAVQVFESGYDLRHGAALAISVVTTELLTRICWTTKQRLLHKRPWSHCMPSARNPELHRMLTIAHGSLCTVDGVDAALRSGGNLIHFLLNANFIAWIRFSTLAFKELTILCRSGHLDHEEADRYLESELERLTFDTRHLQARTAQKCATNILTKP